MAKILSINQIITLTRSFKKQQSKRTTVLVGGCFDILHPGHVVFLEKAKKAGDILIVLLENDEKVEKLKGAGRPVHSQKERAKVLSALKAVDFVVLLPFMESDKKYDKLIAKIRPDVIAATSKDTNTAHFRRSAKLVGAKLQFVTKKIGNYSTSGILGDRLS